MLMRQFDEHHDDIICLLIHRIRGIVNAGEHCGGVAQHGPSTKIICGILASVGEREEGQPLAGEEGPFLRTEPSPCGLGRVDRLSAGRLCRSSRVLLQGCTLTAIMPQ